MHQTVLHIALSNAAVATALAVVALAVTIAFRRPALSHAAWLLVLLKLLTPPLFTVPVEWPAASPGTPALSDETAPFIEPIPVELEAGLLLDESIGEIAVAGAFAADAQPLPAPLPASIPPMIAQTDWPLVLTSVWAFGSSIVLVLIASRLWRFRRLLQFATVAPTDVQSQVESLCDELEIRARPTVWFLPGGVCPMLVGFGRSSRILVPRDLWMRLDDDDQRATLLVHELAHLRRGDQWVRLIELLVTVLYWWNPVAWFARRELREAEEQCCDAWVVFAMPRSARHYAVALMEAIDMTTRARPVVVPVLGSGMGEFHHLRRRLIMIKQGKVARALTWSGFGAMCGAGALLLPLSPTFALQDLTPVTTETVEAAEADPFSTVEQLTEIDGLLELTAPADGAEAAAVVEESLPPSLQRNAAQAEREAQRAALNAEIAATNQVVQQLSRELERAKARLAQLQKQQGVTFRDGGTRHAPHRLPSVRPGSVTLRGGGPAIAQAAPTRDPQVVNPMTVPGAGSPFQARRVRPTQDPAGRTRGDRLEMLERQLAELLNEVRTLKQQQQQGTPGISGFGMPGMAAPPQPAEAPAALPPPTFQRR